MRRVLGAVARRPVQSGDGTPLRESRPHIWRCWTAVLKRQTGATCTRVTTPVVRVRIRLRDQTIREPRQVDNNTVRQTKGTRKQIQGSFPSLRQGQDDGAKQTTAGPSTAWLTMRP